MSTVLHHQSANGTGRPLAIEFQDQLQDDAWDEFVESLPDGHHEQTSRWGQVRAKNGWEVCRILVRENGRIVAGTQMQTRSLRRLGKMAYITYGPCLRSHDPILENAMIAGLKQRARLMGVRFMVVGLPYDGHYLVPAFVAAGFPAQTDAISTAISGGHRGDQSSPGSGADDRGHASPARVGMSVNPSNGASSWLSRMAMAYWNFIN